MIIDPSLALPGRDTPLRVSGVHAVSGRSMLPPFPQGHEVVVLGLGCFWGPNACSGSCQGCMSPQWAMPVG